MSNYTQTTFFTPKDSLPITDPNKTIFGAAYDVEFANIAAAVATKLDSTFTNPSLLSLNVTGAATPANGISLPSANTLGIYAGSVQVINATATLVTFNVPVSLSLGSGIITAGGFNANASAVPANGIYLPSANTLGFAANTTAIGTWATGGMVIGSATGGAKGAGTINATGLFVNGVAAGGAAQTFNGGPQSAAAIAVGQTFIISRSSNTSVTSNTTQTSDAQLSFTSLPIGTYVYQMSATFLCGAISVGATINMSAGGTSVTNHVGSSFIGQNTSVVIGGWNNAIGQTTGTAGVSAQQFGAWATGGFTIATAANGSITLQWAQFTSSGSATTIQQNSYISVTRIA